MSGAVVGLFIFLFFGAAGAAYYFLVYKKEQDKKKEKETSTEPSTSPSTETSTEPSTSPSTEPSTSPSTTRESVLATGQALESEEIDVGTGKRKVTNQPVIADKSKVTYTLSMDINIVKAPENPFRLLHNRDDNDNSTATIKTQRRPELWTTGSKSTDGANRLWINHVGDTGLENISPTFKATVGEYFNLTYVIDNGKGTAYINGVKDGEYSGNFTWSQETDNWTWNMYGDSTNPSIKVKNVYFFNKALTVSEIELIGKKPTSGTSTYTLPPTDNFSSEPHSIQPFSIKMCDI